MSNAYFRYDEETSRGKPETYHLKRSPCIDETNGNWQSPPSDQRFAQPLPSQLRSASSSGARHTQCASARANPHTEMSRSSSEEDLHRSVTVSVVRDTGTKVELMLRAHGMRKNKGFINSLVTAFKKPHQPSRLLANGRFTDFTIKKESLRFVLLIHTEKKKKKGNGNRLDTFLCDIKQFPSPVNPDSAEFEILEPASGEPFILLTLMKVSTGINWKEFLDTHGTLDAKEI